MPNKQLLQPLNEEDKKDLIFLNILLNKSKNTAHPKTLSIIRKYLYESEDSFLLNLMFSKTENLGQKQRELVAFCRNDIELSAYWQACVKAHPTSPDFRINSVDGTKTIHPFDHYLGNLCYFAVLNRNIQRNEKEVLLELAHGFGSYNAIVFKSDAILKKFQQATKDNKTSRDQLLSLEKTLFSLISELANSYWALGNFKASLTLAHYAFFSEQIPGLNNSKVPEMYMAYFIQGEYLLSQSISTQIFKSFYPNKSINEVLIDTYHFSSEIELQNPIEAIKNIFRNDIGEMPYADREKFARNNIKGVLQSGDMMRLEEANKNSTVAVSSSSFFNQKNSEISNNSLPLPSQDPNKIAPK